jgi:hypothetical protein
MRRGPGESRGRVGEECGYDRCDRTRYLVECGTAYHGRWTDHLLLPEQKRYAPLVSDEVNLLPKRSVLKHQGFNPATTPLITLVMGHSMAASTLKFNENHFEIIERLIRVRDGRP